MVDAVTHLEKVITGEVSAVTHLEKVIDGETSAVTYTEKVIAGEAPPITHLQRVIAGVESPVTHLEHVWAGGTPTPTEHEYTGAVPYTFTADGTPLLDWYIKGNMSQTGTPTSTTPIQPQETGERTGNLFDKDSVMVGGIDADGSIAPNGNMRASDYIRVNPNTVYAATYLTIAYYGRTIAYYDTNKNLISTGSNIVQSEDGTATYTITTPNNCYYVRIATYVRVTNHVDDIMFNLGTTPLPYEPYGYKIPISSGGVTTNIYLGSTQSTRQIKKYTFTGEEIVTDNFGVTMVQGLFSSKPFKVGYMALSDRYTYNPIQSGLAAGLADGEFALQGVNYNVAIKDLRYPDATSFKTFLQNQYSAGTPVTIWYVLETPETATVNEPLRKIGDYADTLTATQAGVSIPTNNGNTTIDIDTTLKPSEVYIKYMG